MISENVNSILRVIISNFQTPVVIVLLVLMVATVIVTGTFVYEFFIEHRKLKADIPQLIEAINKAEIENISNLIAGNKLLPRQKKVLHQLIDEKKMEENTRET